MPKYTVYVLFDWVAFSINNSYASLIIKHKPPPFPRPRQTQTEYMYRSMTQFPEGTSIMCDIDPYNQRLNGSGQSKKGARANVKSHLDTISNLKYNVVATDRG